MKIDAIADSLVLGNILIKPTAQTAHLVFADTLTNAKKPKELFFANALTEIEYMTLEQSLKSSKRYNKWILRI